VTFSYVGFWYTALYLLSWAKRKFDPTYTPSAPRMFHNMWYTFLGVVQWTAWEVVFVYMWANDKLPFISDKEAFSSWPNVLRMAGWSLVIPLWRELHFYLAHRLIHLRVLYKYVHSLHHRNVDPEPFSGLCMHPVEHLYYYSCILPSLFFLMSPFHFLWNFIHLVLSPAASHSGWEDHWQSDQFHYLHHRRFECNYGTPLFPVDLWFGTFRDKIGESATYKGQGEIKEVQQGEKEGLKKGKTGTLTIADMLPSFEQGCYNVTFCAILCIVYAALVGGYGVERWHIGPIGASSIVGGLLSFGPIVAGLVIHLFGTDKLSLKWPFHKENTFGPFGFHLIVCSAVTVLPVYYSITTAMM